MISLVFASISTGSLKLSANVKSEVAVKNHSVGTLEAASHMSHRALSVLRVAYLAAKVSLPTNVTVEAEYAAAYSVAFAVVDVITM